MGSLFVVSAPSGTGKTTLVETLIPRVPGLEMSRSYTSRPPRPGERDGVEYHFVSRERFDSMRDAGAFLEWADVFGHLYGTSAVDTRRHLDAGRDLVLVIDVQGAIQIRRLDRARSASSCCRRRRPRSRSACADVAGAISQKRKCGAGWRWPGVKSSGWRPTTTWSSTTRSRTASSSCAVSSWQSARRGAPLERRVRRSPGPFGTWGLARLV